MKRRSKKQKELIQVFIFFFVTVFSIGGLIAYLWVYTEIDETLLTIEIQNTTMTELNNDVQELRSKIEQLGRADVIAYRARNELNMVVARPETVSVYVDENLLTNSYD